MVMTGGWFVVLLPSHSKLSDLASPSGTWIPKPIPTSEPMLGDIVLARPDGNVWLLADTKNRSLENKRPETVNKINRHVPKLDRVSIRRL